MGNLGDLYGTPRLAALARSTIPQTTQTAILFGSGENTSEFAGQGGDRIEEVLIRLGLTPIRVSVLCLDPSQFGGQLCSERRLQGG